MGQKVNPHGLRVGIIKDWDSRWFVSKSVFGETLVEDYRIREYFAAKTYRTDKSPVPMKPGISLVEIERDATKVKVFIHTAKPGILIGSKGSGIEIMKRDLEKITKGKPVNLNIIEVRDLDLNAQLVAEAIAQQLEARVSFRRAMKQVIGRTMRAGAKGIKTAVSGRLGGAEIARAESYKEGTIPLQTLRADIDYGTARANTTYGVIGVKVWIYKGEVLKGEVGAAKKRLESMKREPRDNRKPRGEKRFDGRSNDRFRGDRPGNRENRVRDGGNAPQDRTAFRADRGHARPQTTAGAPAPAPAVAPKNEGGNE
ncbi:MAG: 30S ribosomal protein S3 [Oscillospiraceae bacterium]|nr:30S ribosomal protein S3 [Oscillospiraceae bacterium]